MSEGSVKYEVRTTRLAVVPVGEDLFSERATNIEIMDEAAGEFVVITQQSGHAETPHQQIRLDAGEWPFVRDAIQQMMDACREQEK